MGVMGAYWANWAYWTNGANWTNGPVDPVGP